LSKERVGGERKTEESEGGKRERRGKRRGERRGRERRRERMKGRKKEGEEGKGGENGREEKGFSSLFSSLSLNSFLVNTYHFAANGFSIIPPSLPPFFFPPFSLSLSPPLSPPTPFPSLSFPLASPLPCSVRVYHCSTYYKAVHVGGGGSWRTCAARRRPSFPFPSSSLPPPAKLVHEKKEKGKRGKK
jgi:hypothetical protein